MRHRTTEAPIDNQPERKILPLPKFEKENEKAMAILSTLPAEGGEPTYYEVPDDQLSGFEQIEMKKVSSSDAQQGGQQVDAPGAVKVEGDVQAYNDVCICYIYNRVTGEVLYWYYCRC